MSVDTKTKGRNLAPYARLSDGARTVLITRDLTHLAQGLFVDTKGLTGRRFQVTFVDPTCRI